MPSESMTFHGFSTAIELFHTADIAHLLNISPIINIDVSNKVQIRTPVSARALYQQRLHEANPGRLSKIGLGDWCYSNIGLSLGPCEDIIGG